MSSSRLQIKRVTASSHSGHFRPENVLVDKPDDHNSRWSGAYHTASAFQRHKQWLKLELEQLSVVKAITFGKFKTVHPCNMDHFRVYGSIEDTDDMTEMLSANLKNDDIPQIFALSYTNEEDVPFPCKFIKIVPLTPATQTYNISVWSIALHGISDPGLVTQVMENSVNYRETLTMRLILKHLRSRRLNEAYEKLLNDTGLRIEHPMISELHGALVMNGDYAGAEKIWGSFAQVSEVATSTMMDNRGSVPALLPDLTSCPTTSSSETGRNASHLLQTAALSPVIPKTVWRRLHPSVMSSTKITPPSSGPCARGGHVMVIDPMEGEGRLSGSGGLIYLFGGWDGIRDHADFWIYDIGQSQWQLVSEDVSSDDGNRGPTPRSCGAAVLDPKSGDIYFVGRYANNGSSDPISRGPGELVFTCGNLGNSMSNGQHQQQSQIINSDQISYTQVVNATGTPPTALAPSSSTGVSVSGGTSASTSRRSRPRRGGVESGNGDTISEARSSNSPSSRGVGGKEDSNMRSNECKSDFWRYSTRGPNQGKWELICGDTAMEGGPELTYDLAMVMDSEKQVLYVFGGRLHSDLEQGEKKYGAFYSYEFKSRKWKRIFGDQHGRLNNQRHIPSRERHSMVFDSKHHNIYILGGERGDQALSDIFIYSTVTGDIAEVTMSRDSPHPRPLDILRATFNELSREIYVVSGLSSPPSTHGRDTEGRSSLRISLWIYSMDSHAWTPVPEQTRIDDDGEFVSAMDAEGTSPRPRLGHSVVYDPHRHIFYAFGGNAGAEVRLDDFWMLSLVRPGIQDILRKGSLAIRRQRFTEMCEDGSTTEALQYLQSDISALVDHQDEDEISVFRGLLSLLLSRPSTPYGANPVQSPHTHDIEMTDVLRSATTDPVPVTQQQLVTQTASEVRDRQRHAQRTAIFEELLAYIDPKAKQPRADLVDLVRGAFSGRRVRSHS